jgi:hypothetical protein
MLCMLWEQVQAYLTDTDQSSINMLFNDMPVRVQAVWKARSEATRF